MSDDFIVKIVNFQRIKKATLVFSPGLNVIVGESNNGKTNVYRGLNALLFNSSRESYVTLGETKAAVGVKYRGHEVIWRRDNKAASPTTYRVDGKIYSKIGRGVLPSVAEVLGIREVELDDMKIRLNFQRQMEYPFLLDKTPSQLFKFIMQSAEEDNIMQVIKNMKKDLAQMGSNIRSYEDTREELRRIFEREADRYRTKKKAIPYCDVVIGLENEVRRCEHLEELVGRIKENIEKIVELEKKSKLVLSKLEILDKCIESACPGLDEIGMLTNIIAGVKMRTSMVDNANSELEFLERKITRFSTLESIDLGKVDKLKEIYSKLQKLISEFSVVTGRISKIEGRCGDIDSKLDDVEQELKTFDVCPYCGNKL